jgi:maltooligosyltrehalose trehalohydrolase
VLVDFYREVIALRRELAPISFSEKESTHVIDLSREQTVCIHYWSDREDVFLVLCFSQTKLTTTLPLPSGEWSKRLDSAEERWGGPGSRISKSIRSSGRVEATLSPTSCLVFHQQNLDQ